MIIKGIETTILIKYAFDGSWRDKTEPNKNRKKLNIRAFFFLIFLLGIGLEGRLTLSISRSKTSLIEFAPAVYAITTKTTNVSIALWSRQSKIAADIKNLKPVEPYKAKGIKEKGQFILRKEGKKK